MSSVPSNLQSSGHHLHPLFFTNILYPPSFFKDRTTLRVCVCVCLFTHPLGPGLCPCVKRQSLLGGFCCKNKTDSAWILCSDGTTTCSRGSSEVSLWKYMRCDFYAWHIWVSTYVSVFCLGFRKTVQWGSRKGYRWCPFGSKVCGV